MPSNRTLRILSLLLLLGLAVTSVPAQTTDPGEKVIIRAAKPYTGLVTRIESLGGRVTYQYKYVDAIAAQLPRSAMPALRGLLGTAAITKDEEIAIPEDGDTLRGRRLSQSSDTSLIETEGVSGLNGDELQALASAHPNAYQVNNAIANVSSLHASGITGQGVIVAVIDSGIRPGFPHISLDGSVIGCEDFVGDALGCINSGNNFHGTFVAGMISANVVFSFSTASATRNAVLAECAPCFLNPPTYTQIPMIGTAPLSSIYALRVFGATGGAPTSRILTAVERAIELREMYDAGTTGGSNIQVLNMSLGGSTLFAGRDLFDAEVDVLLQKGIVTTISASNNGPSSLTVGSPGSAFNAITVGAASLPHNERIYRRLQYGAALGSLYRPFLGVQTSYFSSRGPDADGRVDPDVTSNGFANFGQGSGATNSITIGSGTSFSSPSVAGVAALLRQAFPSATARQIRNAIIASANPNLLSDGSTVLDQGAGYVDGAGAAALLAAGTVADTFPAPSTPTKNVKVNVEQGTSLRVRDGFINEHASNLKPGERYEVVYRVNPNTKQVIIVLSGVTPSLPPAQQNQLFGDDILFAVHSAKTSAIGASGDYLVFEFSLGGTFVLDNPESGLMRITVNGDWTNAGTVSADVTVLSLTEALPQFTTQGMIADQELQFFPINIPAGVSAADFLLGWREDWGNYPAADVDLILIDPVGGLNFDGATSNNPERAIVSKPMAGQWIAVVQGYEIHTGTDKFELRVALDGKVVKK